MRRWLGLLVVLGILDVALLAPARAAGAATGGMVYEKFTTLDESFRVAQRLRQAGFDVVLTRTTDKHVDLGKRAAMARDAHLLVSIHNNGSTSRGVVGTEAYYQIGNRFGGQLASDMVRAISAKAGTVVRGAFTRKGQNGDYYAVLRETRTTAIIVEGAFLSNPDEARRLATPEFRAAIADGIAEVISKRLVLDLVPQGAGPQPPKQTLVAAPSGLQAKLLGGRGVELTWDPPAATPVVELWRDGRFLGRTDQTSFRDTRLSAGRHRYEIRAVMDVAGLLAQHSRSLATEVVVPWRIVLDPGHGGRDPGAVGRW